MKDCNVLKNRSESMNRVHEYINTVAPLVRERLTQGFKTKVGGTMYQKDADDIRAILDAHMGILSLKEGRTGFGAYVSCSDYSITLEVNDHYPVKYHSDGSGGYTCDYYKYVTYLWDFQNKKPHDGCILPMTCLADMEAAQANLKEIEQQVSELESTKHTLKRLLGK